MNEARVYADGFERSFAEVKDLLEFLAERGRNAKWIRKPTNTLRLAPLEKEAQNLDAADASMEEILEDTEKNTQLVLKMRGESYPVRDCAIRTILSRAGVNGDGLRKLDKATYAKVVNYCLRVAKGDALIKIADGKVSAVHGGDKHDYCILDMKAMFETTCEYLNLNFKGSVYMEALVSMTIPLYLPCGSSEEVRNFWILTEKHWMHTEWMRRSCHRHFVLPHLTWQRAVQICIRCF